MGGPDWTTLTVLRLKKSHHFISSIEHSNWHPYLIANIACHLPGLFKIIRSTMQMPFLKWIQLLNKESRVVHQQSKQLTQAVFCAVRPLDCWLLRFDLLQFTHIHIISLRLKLDLSPSTEGAPSQCPCHCSTHRMCPCMRNNEGCYLRRTYGLFRLFCSNERVKGQES